MELHIALRSQCSMVPKASGPLFRKSLFVLHRHCSWSRHMEFCEGGKWQFRFVTRVLFPSKQIRYNLEDLIFNWSFVMMKEVGVYPLYILWQRKLFSIMDLFRLPLDLDFMPRNTNVIYPRQGQMIGFPITPFVWSFEMYESHSRQWSRRLQDHFSEISICST